MPLVIQRLVPNMNARAVEEVTRTCERSCKAMSAMRETFEADNAKADSLAEALANER